MSKSLLGPITIVSSLTKEPKGNLKSIYWETQLTNFHTTKNGKTPLMQQVSGKKLSEKGKRFGLFGTRTTLRGFTRSQNYRSRDPLEELLKDVSESDPLVVGVGVGDGVGASGHGDSGRRKLNTTVDLYTIGALLGNHAVVANIKREL